MKSEKFIVNEGVEVVFKGEQSIPEVKIINNNDFDVLMVLEEDNEASKRIEEYFGGEVIIVEAKNTKSICGGASIDALSLLLTDVMIPCRYY